MGECFPMKGGDGAYSYTKNSQLQKEWSDSVKEMIQDAVIDKLDAEISTTVRIVDFGCSVGPNTFFTVQNLIQAVQNKFCDSKNELIEFQVFFNDHSGNDFNTLFASLPFDRQYHAAGVPGSFHGRLFPRGSITVAQSSYALQWLSKQPGGVPNEGRIYCSGAPENVARAYSDQFESDLGDFMSARAEEIVSGGLMFLALPVIPDDVDGASHSGLCVLFDFLGYALIDLVNEGEVEKSAVDAFNLPIYFPKVGEVRKVIEKKGSSCFSIERMEVIDVRSQVEEAINVASLIVHLRAGVEGVLSAHFGSRVVDKMFHAISAKAQQLSRYLGGPYYKSTQLLVVLKHK